MNNLKQDIATIIINKNLDAIAQDIEDYLFDNELVSETDNKTMKLIDDILAIAINTELLYDEQD